MLLVFIIHLMVELKGKVWAQYDEIKVNLEIEFRELFLSNKNLIKNCVL